MVLDAIKRRALAYHHRSSRGPQGERVVRSLSAHLGRLDSLLDIGCGDGVNLKKLAAAASASRFVGVDVFVRPSATIEVVKYDGRNTPFPTGSFAGVTIVDVLHHCDDAERVLAEALRIATKVVAIKDHFAFGPVTNKMLYWMNIVGNAKDGIHIRATTCTPTSGCA